MTVDYDSWRTASPYDDDQPEPEGWVRVEDVQSEENTRDFLQGIVEAVYQTGDTEDLEHCLEELCAMYDVNINKSAPVLETKNKNRLMHWYLGYQRATIEQMNGGTRCSL